MEKNKEGEYEGFLIDFSATIFILLVLFYHHFLYVEDYSFELFHKWVLNIFNLELIDVFLKNFGTFPAAGFFFLSGYKMAKYKIKSSEKEFLKNRFFRIFPLYWISLLGYVILIVETDFFTFVKHLLGLQIILPHALSETYLTLYFIGLLIPFYLIFILLKQDIRKLIPRSILIFLICFLFYGLGLFDIRFFYFYSFFIFGMIVSQIEISKKHILPLIFLFPIILYFAEYKLFEDIYIIFLIELLIIPSFIILKYFFGGINIPKVVKKIFFYMSFSTYSIFLFHRIIWILLGDWINNLFTMILAAVTISYVIQKTYDSIFRK